MQWFFNSMKTKISAIFRSSLLGVLFLMGLHVQNGQAQLVIVVPQSSPYDSLTVTQLRHIFKGEPIDGAQQKPIQIIEFKPESEAFYQRLYGLSRYSIAKYWLRLIFSGERVTPPKSFSDPDKACRYLCKNGHAISFLPVELYQKLQKSHPIKAVAIDGLTYRDDGYYFNHQSGKRGDEIQGKAASQ